LVIFPPKPNRILHEHVARVKLRYSIAINEITTLSIYDMYFAAHEPFLVYPRHKSIWFAFVGMQHNWIASYADVFLQMSATGSHMHGRCKDCGRQKLYILHMLGWYNPNKPPNPSTCSTGIFIRIGAAKGFESRMQHACHLMSVCLSAAKRARVHTH
jgi:hypothetical protein